jgi:hypothetical protein
MQFRISARKSLAILFVGAVMFASASAKSEADLRKVKCAEFSAVMQSKEKEAEVAGALYLGFLWGFYKDENQPPIAGTASDNEKAAKLGKYCAENPEVDIITAADKLWIKK